MEDTIDPAILGSAVHKALNKLYIPFIDQTLTFEHLSAMEKVSDVTVDKAFKKKFKGSDITSGKNLLLVRVAKIMVKRFLQYEKEQIEELEGSGKNFTVVFLEHLFETSVSIPYGEKELNIRMKGFIDRVDRMDGWWRIIDYKTGTTESKQVKLNDWDDLSEDPDLNIGFQLLMYAWLLACRFRKPVLSSAGLISLKKLNSGFTAVSVPGEEPGKLTSILNQATTGRFEEIIRTILTDVYDLKKSFTQTNDRNICSRCPYINLCGR